MKQIYFNNRILIFCFAGAAGGILGALLWSMFVRSVPWDSFIAGAIGGVLGGLIVGWRAPRQ